MTTLQGTGIGFAAAAVSLFAYAGISGGRQFVVRLPDATAPTDEGVASSLPPRGGAPLVASSGAAASRSLRLADIEPQSPLANPPEVIRGIYVTSWSAGTAVNMARIRKILRETEANAVVIDIKDYSGSVTYATENPEALRYGARSVRIPRVNALIKELHDEGVYVIGRVSVFQDPVFAAARPELAVQNRETGEVWLDQNKLAWIDPASREAWAYAVSVARDAFSRGFDEVNFDYIRFPSDGAMEAIAYPIYDPVTTLKRSVLRDFFRYLRAELPDRVISADIFGMTTVHEADIGVGQILEDAYESFDVVSPMIYPSHYATGFIGFENPAEHPYEVVLYSASEARRRLETFTARASGPRIPRLRFWLQDFNLGAVYTAEKVRAQMTALEDAGVTSGWLLWDPSNKYTLEALRAKSPADQPTTPAP